MCVITSDATTVDVFWNGTSIARGTGGGFFLGVDVPPSTRFAPESNTLAVKLGGSMQSARFDMTVKSASQ